MLIDRRNLAAHLPWIIVAVAATIAASLWYFGSSIGKAEWPGGGSLPGFTFGVVGGLIILFELLLWWRKKVRTWRIGRTQVWVRAHIWLGLLTVPLLVLHSGFHLGGTLSTVLMVLLLIVIASGIWGLVLQQLLPRQMLDQVPAETIYSQIDRIVAQFHEEAEQLVEATCGPAEGENGAHPAAAEAPEPFLTVGAVRSVGQVQGKVLQTRVPREPVPGSEPLRAFFRSTIGPFLQPGGVSNSLLRFPNRSAVMFDDLRTKLDRAAHDAVDALENLCAQRRQLAVQARLHVWLHTWLWVHLPLSVALVVLMGVHIWAALKYW